MSIRHCIRCKRWLDPIEAIYDGICYICNSSMLNTNNLTKINDLYKKVEIDKAALDKCTGIKALKKAEVDKAAIENSKKIFPAFDKAKHVVPTFDPVNKPEHYNSHPSGIECIRVTEHMSFCIGNAIKYLWRYKRKNGVEDLKKARWYINNEIDLLEKEANEAVAEQDNG